MTSITRREFAALAATAVVASPAFAQTPALLARPIATSGERLPAVGLGTAQVFDVNDETTRQKATRGAARARGRRRPPRRHVVGLR